MYTINMPFSLEVVHSCLIDIDESLRKLRAFETAHGAMIEITRTISIARLAYEETLRLKLLHDSNYRVLADQIDDLILLMRHNIFKFPPHACCSDGEWTRFRPMFVQLMDEFERIDLRLKTIRVVGPKRPRCGAKKEDTVVAQPPDKEEAEKNEIDLDLLLLQQEYADTLKVPRWYNLFVSIAKFLFG